MSATNERSTRKLKMMEAAELERFCKRVAEMRAEGMNTAFIAQALGVGKVTVRDREKRWAAIRSLGE